MQTTLISTATVAVLPIFYTMFLYPWWIGILNVLFYIFVQKQNTVKPR